MESGVRATVLAAYSTRRRVIRNGDGGVHIFWEMVGVRMSQAEFVGFASMLSEAAERAIRCGELARCPCGRVSRCAMGQVMLSHKSLTLWFSPEEFEDLARLVARAREKLADLAPTSSLGTPWTPPAEYINSN